MKQLFTRCALAAVLVAAGHGLADAQVPVPAQVPENDPFFKPVKPKPQPVKPPDKWQEVPYPSLEQRQADYQRSRRDAQRAGQPVPNPVGQFLVRELRVTGIFEVDGRVGIFVEAGPQNQAYFLTEGTRLYNGELVRVEQGEYPTPGRAVFRERVEYTLRKQRKTDIVEVVRTVGQ